MEAIHFILSKAAWNVNLTICLFDVPNKSLSAVTAFNLITAPAIMVEGGLGYTLTFDKLVNAMETSTCASARWSRGLKRDYIWSGRNTRYSQRWQRHF